MSLTIWLAGMFILGLAAMSLCYAFLVDGVASEWADRREDDQRASSQLELRKHFGAPA